MNLYVTRYRFREAGHERNTMSTSVKERTTTHTSRKIVSHGGPISGQRDGGATANSLENNLGKSLNMPPAHVTLSIRCSFSHLSFTRHESDLLRDILVFADFEINLK